MSKVHISEVPRRIATAAAGIVFSCGVAVLFGWTFGVVPLKGDEIRRLATAECGVRPAIRRCGT